MQCQTSPRDTMDATYHISAAFPPHHLFLPTSPVISHVSICIISFISQGLLALRKQLLSTVPSHLPGCRALAPSDSADTNQSHSKYSSFPVRITIAGKHRCILHQVETSTLYCPNSSISIPFMLGIGLLSLTWAGRPGTCLKKQNMTK